MAGSPATSRMSPLDRVLRLVAPVNPGEALTALLLTLNVFLLLLCYYVTKVAREPLILLGGGAELKAYASAGQALLLLLVIPLFGILASRVNRIRLLTTMQAAFAVCLVVFYALAKAEAPIGLAFYLWVGIFGAMVVSNFWSFANDLYSHDQGKRLFPIVGVGGSVGAILGALLPPRLRELVGGHELLLIAAGGLLVSIALYRVIDRRERIERDERGTVALTKPEAVRPVEREGGFTLVAKDRYLRLMAALVLVSTIVNTNGEYVISKLATDASAVHATEQLERQVDPPPPTDKAGHDKAIKRLRGAYIGDFFSSYYGLVNLLSALLQAFAVSRIFARLGVRGSLFVLPVVVLVGWVGFLAYAALAMIRVTKTAENCIDYSVQNTVRQALYLPTSRASKYKAKAAIDTFVFRLADFIAGVGIVTLLVTVLGLGVRAFALVNLGLVVVWIGLAIWTGRLFDQRTKERAERAAKGLRETMV